MRKTDDEFKIGYGYQPRACYASDPSKSRGRLVPEASSLTRTPFQRDRDRIIHSNAFRRLKHKTQVFIAHEDDHFRTRLTHSIEVSQIARALARALRLDEELAEAIALAHDFGHPPFGHAGEDALNDIMVPYGGFDHNAQTLRIVTKLEHRYAAFDGLNLSWETLEGLVKHNGPLAGPHAEKKDIAQPILDYNKVQNLELQLFAGPEAQCAAIADDIAYNAHDIDDGLRSGLLSFEQLEQVTLGAELIDDIRKTAPDKDLSRYGYELVRRQITAMVEDVIEESLQRLSLLKPQTVDDIHHAGRTMITFSARMAVREKELKTFLYKNLYFHDYVMDRRLKAVTIVRDLFKAYVENPQYLPPDWQEQANELNDAEQARLTADFLSGMTDHYAIREHQRLFDQTPNLA